MNKDFDPEKIERISIDLVVPNIYNPKVKDSEEYKQVKQSLVVNGLIQPIFVREEDGNDKYVIVDGEQRYTAAKELGYEEIYVYNLGNIPEKEAKALTIWFEVQVPFDEMQLAPLVVELADNNVELPYNDDLIFAFYDLVNFNLDEALDEHEQQSTREDDGLVELAVRMTDSQYEFVENAIKEIQDVQDISMGAALVYLCSDNEVGDE